MVSFSAGPHLPNHLVGAAAKYLGVKRATLKRARARREVRCLRGYTRGQRGEQ
jgi:hypothetical protein